MTYPRFQRARDFKFLNYTAGSMTLNSTTWSDLPGVSAALDVTLAAQIGDVLLVGLSHRVGAELSYALLTACTRVSSAAVNHIAGWLSTTTGNGVPAWLASGNVALDGGLGGAVMYTVVSGDLESGTVTLRLRYRTAAATNKTLYASTSDPLQFWVRNLGPVDPH